MNEKLSRAELLTNEETRKHINNVREYIFYFTDILRDRAMDHDKSKLNHPEVKIFTEYTSKLAEVTYGSDKYKEFLREMKPALDHHYAKNRHHIEHYKNGIEDMTLIDIIEMFCDWKAATLRHNDGNLLKSIDINEKRFKINPQLSQIFRNMAELFEHKPK